MTYFIIYLSILNILAFLAFFIDKKRAEKDKWRIKESSLHLLSFAGGAIGSLIAMILFRHKTKKVKFIAITSLAILLNVAVIVWSIMFVTGNI